MLSALRRCFVGTSPRARAVTTAAPIAAETLEGLEAVARVADVLSAEKGLKAVKLSNGTPVVLVSRGGAIQSALYGLCPHKQADMALGDIEDSSHAANIEGGACLKCPRHRKKYNGGLNFNLASGKSWVIDPPSCMAKYDPDWRLPVFDFVVKGDVVYVATAPKSGEVPAAGAAAESPTVAAAADGSPVAGTAAGAAAAVSLAASTGGASTAVCATAATLVVPASAASGKPGKEKGGRDSPPASPRPAPAHLPGAAHVPGFSPVCTLEEALASSKRLKGVALADGTPIVLIVAGGAVTSALYGLCPHKEASMWEGDIEEAGASGGHGLSVKCPRHRKKFNGGLYFTAADGQSWVDTSAPCVAEYKCEWALPRYEVQTVGGVVYVADAPLPRTSASGGAGTTVSCSPTSSAAAPAVAAAPPSTDELMLRLVTDPKEGAVGWVPATITSITQVSHDSAVYRITPAAAAAAAAARATSPAATAPPACDQNSWHVHLCVAPVEGSADDHAAAAAAALDDLPTASVASPSVARRAAAPLSVASLALRPVTREYTPVSPLAAWAGSGAGHTPVAAAGSAAAAAAAAAGGGAGGAPYMDVLIKHYASAGGLTARLARAGASARVWVSSPRTTLHTPSLQPPGPAVEPPTAVAATATAVTPTTTVADVPGVVPSASTGVSTGMPARSLEYDAGAATPTVPPALVVAAAGTSPFDRATGRSALLLIAGGTGIAPMMQLLRWALQAPPAAAAAPALPSHVALVYSSRTPGDVLMARELVALATEHSDRVRLLLTFTRDAAGVEAIVPPGTAANVSTAEGRVSAGTVRGAAAGLPAGVSVARVVISGPEGMMETAHAAVLDALAGQVSEEAIVELEA